MRYLQWCRLFFVAFLACHQAASEVAAAEPANAAPAAPAKAELQQKLLSPETSQGETERLRAETGQPPQQLLIRLKMLEISRTRLERLGYDFGDGGLAGLFAPSSEPQAPGASENQQAQAQAASTRAKIAILKPESEFKKLLQSWDKEGAVVRSLGEPNIVTISGRPANIRVGGEFPLTTPASAGKTRTEMRFYGTKLDAIPLLLDDGRVRLEVRLSVSEIDEERAILVDGVIVPGLRVREIDTGVELGVGETAAISGFTPMKQQKAQQGGAAPDARQRPQQDSEQLELLVLASIDFVDAAAPAVSPAPPTRKAAPAAPSDR